MRVCVIKRRCRQGTLLLVCWHDAHFTPKVRTVSPFFLFDDPVKMLCDTPMCATVFLCERPQRRPPWREPNHIQAEFLPHIWRFLWHQTAAHPNLCFTQQMLMLLPQDVGSCSTHCVKKNFSGAQAHVHQRRSSSLLGAKLVPYPQGPYWVWSGSLKRWTKEKAMTNEAVEGFFQQYGKKENQRIYTPNRELSLRNGAMSSMSSSLK